MPCASASRLPAVSTASVVAATASCTVGSHEALRADAAAWAALPLRPDWPVLGEVIQLRDCPRCGSTLATKLDGERSAASRGAE
jgi:hypothetical protein